MVSTIIISPQHDQNIRSANKDFNVVLAVDNLAAGQFTNPDTTYYSAPQQLNKNGNILGHTHITIQVRPCYINRKTDDRTLVILSTLLSPSMLLTSPSSWVSIIQRKGDVYLLLLLAGYPQDFTVSARWRRLRIINLC